MLVIQGSGARTSERLETLCADARLGKTDLKHTFLFPIIGARPIG